MHRRSALQLLASTASALIVTPKIAQAAWQLAASDLDKGRARALDATQAALTTALADTIVPRTDTPSATDVAVPAWIDIIVGRYYTDTERAKFASALTAIDQFSRAVSGAPFAELGEADRPRVMQALEQAANYNTNEEANTRTSATGTESGTDMNSGTIAARGYVQLKRLVLHGYFTSKVVQQHILKVQIMPGRFEGNVPYTAAN